MKKIIIHCGPGKTGSSALQYSLLQQTSWLAEQGIWYPPHEVDGNHISSGHKNLLLTEVDGQWQLDAAKLAELIATFEQGPCHTLLLSSEYFFPLLPALHQALPQARLVLYVRDPLSQLESNYNQGVKRHGETHAFVVPPRCPFGLLLRLEHWLTADPQLADQLQLRPYLPGAFASGNIVGDLLSCAGLPAPPGLVVAQVNAPYTLAALEFKRHANHFCDDTLSARLDRLLQACRIGIAHYSFIPAQRQLMVRKQLRQQLTSFIARHSFASLGSLLETWQHESERPWVRQHVSADELAEVLGYLNEHDPELVVALAERVRSAPYFHLPNRAFYSMFDSQLSAVPASLPLPAMNAVLTKINEQPEHGLLTLCRELAPLLEKAGEPQAAMILLQTALRQRPGNVALQQHFNRLRHASQPTVSPVTASPLPAPSSVSRSLLGRIKQRLLRSR